VANANSPSEVSEAVLHARASEVQTAAARCYVEWVSWWDPRPMTTTFQVSIDGPRFLMVSVEDRADRRGHLISGCVGDRLTRLRWSDHLAFNERLRVETRSASPAPDR